MKVGVEFDMAPFARALGAESGRVEDLASRSLRRLAYATVNAINWAALSVQRDAVKNLERAFTIRTTASRKLLTRNAAILNPRANVGQGRFFADLAVGGAQLSSKTPLLLPRFEAGDERRPFTPGAKRVAVPITGGARPSRTSPVSPSLLISRLALKPKFSRSVARNLGRQARGIRSAAGRRSFYATLGAGQVWLGRERTFMLPRIGIFQRTGSGKGSVRILYSFEEDVRLPASLHFLSLAKKNGGGYLERELSREVAEVLAGRKTSGAPSRLP